MLESFTRALDSLYMLSSQQKVPFRTLTCADNLEVLGHVLSLCALTADAAAAAIFTAERI